MRRDAQGYLWDAIQAAETVLRYTAGKALDDVLEDIVLTGFIERQMITLGEALNQLSNAFPDVGSEITELAEVVAFRNILVHGYRDLDWVQVWGVVQRDLPALKERMQALLDSLG